MNILKIKKTNAMRILDQQKISYEVMSFPYSEKDFDGTHVAAYLNLPFHQVYKTLVLLGEKQGPGVFCLPVDKDVDLKKAAALLGEKKVSLLPIANLLAVTGYVRGGCSPIGMKKHYLTFFHPDCLRQQHIAVSAGQRGLQVFIATKDLLSITQGQIIAD